MLERFIAALLVLLVLCCWQSGAIPAVSAASFIAGEPSIHQDHSPDNALQPGAIDSQRITLVDVVGPPNYLSWQQILNPQDRAAWLVFAVFLVASWIALSQIHIHTMTLHWPDL